MHDLSDDILRRASRGDIEAFEKLYRSTAGFVFNVASRIVVSREDAEEVVQEVFLIVHRKLSGFRFDSSLKTWMYRITVNCSLNYVRQSSSWRQKEVDIEAHMDGTTVEGDAHKQMERDDQERKIELLLGALNPDQRACLVLRNIEGLSYEKIAEALGMNINTVRTRLKRAREKLLSLRKKVTDDTL